MEAGRLERARQLLREAKLQYREATQSLEAEIAVQDAETRRLKTRALNQSAQVHTAFDRAAAIARALLHDSDHIHSDVSNDMQLPNRPSGLPVQSNRVSNVDLILSESDAICELLRDAPSSDDVVSKIDRVLDLLESPKS